MGLFDRNRIVRLSTAQPLVLPRTDEEVRELLKSLPRYRVMLHNDDHNDMDFVVVALVRTVSALSVEDAAQIMLQARLNGSAQVIVCLKELAEHYRERLERYGLTCTIEPE
jgi:ATP-dependent Clp protease adaptor protein ClpS